MRLVKIHPMRGAKQQNTWLSLTSTNTAIVIDATDTPSRGTIANHYL
jgi:hypothetical protein